MPSSKSEDKKNNKLNRQRTLDTRSGSAYGVCLKHLDPEGCSEP